MPYIKKEDRKLLDPHIDKLVSDTYIPGELTYIIYKMLNDLTKIRGKSFSTMSSLISEVECAKLEFYRRVIGPYEDTKIEQNGDVE
jgi:hypothetical protein